MSDLGYDDTKAAAELFTDWGLALMLAGQPTEAEKVYRRAIDIGRSGQGEDAATPALLNGYADSLLKLDRLDEAAKYSEEAYAKAQKVNDVFTMETSLMERSRIYRQEHDLPRAHAMLDQVEPMLRHDLPPGHYAFARLASDRAFLAQDADDSAKALQLVNQAITIDERAIQSGGQGAHLLPVLLLQRSDLELNAHQNDSAEADAARAVSLAQAAIQSGTHSQLVGNSHLALGRALLAEGKADQARRAFLAVADHFEKTVGPDHLHTRTARQLAESALK
jgi:tetratricopeptide (TPR) repeat protein